MGQKIDRDEVHFVSTYDHLCKLRSGNEREVKTITVANSDLVLVRTASVKEGMKVFRKGSIYYAAYCTSFARVELTRVTLF